MAANANMSGAALWASDLVKRNVAAGFEGSHCWEGGGRDGLDSLRGSRETVQVWTEMSVPGRYKEPRETQNVSECFFSRPDNRGGSKLCKRPQLCVS